MYQFDGPIWVQYPLHRQRIGLLSGEVAFLASTLIAIDITLAGLFWAWGAGEDVLAHLVKKTLYVGFFAFLIGNFNALAKIVFNSFTGLGLKAAGSTLSADQFLQPGRLAQVGIDTGKPILQAAGQLMGFVSFFENFIQIFVLLIAWLVVLVAFFILAVQLFVTLIEFKLTTLRAGTRAQVKTRARGLARVTGGKTAANRSVGLLGAIFTFAVRLGLRPDNPVHGSQRFADAKRERRLSDAEYAALGEALRKAEEANIWPAAVAAVRFLAITGWRRGEALGLHRTDIDLARRTVILGDTKSGRSLRPLWHAACDVLRAAMAGPNNDPNGYVSRPASSRNGADY